MKPQSPYQPCSNSFNYYLNSVVPRQEKLKAYLRVVSQLIINNPETLKKAAREAAAIYLSEHRFDIFSFTGSKLARQLQVDLQNASGVLELLEAINAAGKEYEVDSNSLVKYLNRNIIHYFVKNKGQYYQLEEGTRTSESTKFEMITNAIETAYQYFNRDTDSNINNSL
jgi:hypothetical protein